MLLWQPRDILHHYVGDILCEQITSICCLGNGTQSGDWPQTTIISDMRALCTVALFECLESQHVQTKPL